MGNLKIKADGSETLIYEDNTRMVAGSNARLTGGNDAYVTAGVREDVVLGLLVTALLGGNLEVALGRTFLDGTLTRLCGQRYDIGELESIMVDNERIIAAAETQIIEQSAIVTDTAIATSARADGIIVAEQAAGNLSTLVGGTDIAMLQNQINQIGEQVKTIASSVRTVAEELVQSGTVTIMYGENTALREMLIVT